MIVVYQNWHLRELSLAETRHVRLIRTAGRPIDAKSIKDAAERFLEKKRRQCRRYHRRRLIFQSAASDDAFHAASYYARHSAKCCPISASHDVALVATGHSQPYRYWRNTC